MVSRKPGREVRYEVDPAGAPLTPRQNNCAYFASPLPPSGDLFVYIEP